MQSGLTPACPAFSAWCWGGSSIPVDVFLLIRIRVAKKKREGPDYWLICIPYIILYVHIPEIFKAFSLISGIMQLCK